MRYRAAPALPSRIEHRPYVVNARLLDEARDPNTAPSRLLELCEVHPRCRALVAQNPNTPLQTLLRLWAELPEAMLENPAAELLLLENPEAFARAAADILRAIFALPDIPVSFYYSVWDSAPLYRDLMAGSASLPPELALLLSRSEALACRSALAANPALAHIPEVFALLEDDLFPAVRRGVAKNPALPFIFIEALSADEDSEVRENIAKNPSTPAPLLARLAQDHIREVRRAAQRNPAHSRAPQASTAKEKSRMSPPGKRWLLLEQRASGAI